MSLEDWEQEQLAYFETLYREGNYKKLCQTFCHEGVQVLTDIETREVNVRVYVCSANAPTLKELATILLEKVRKGEMGC